MCLSHIFAAAPRASAFGFAFFHFVRMLSTHPLTPSPCVYPPGHICARAVRPRMATQSAFAAPADTAETMDAKERKTSSHASRAVPPDPPDHLRDALRVQQSLSPELPARHADASARALALRAELFERPSAWSAAAVVHTQRSDATPALHRHTHRARCRPSHCLGGSCSSANGIACDNGQNVARHKRCPFLARSQARD